MATVDSFVNQCRSTDRNSFQDENDRRKALAAARAVCARLETPLEAVMRTAWVEPATLPAIRIALDKGVFSKLADAKDGPKTVSEISKATQIDPVLLGKHSFGSVAKAGDRSSLSFYALTTLARLLRHLGTMRVIEEIGPDTYAPTELSDSLTERRINGAFDFLFDVMLPVYTKLPEYLEKTDYKDPSTLPGPFEYATNQGLPFYRWYNEHPKKLEGFSYHMRGYTAGRPGWLDIYPAAELLNTEKPLSDNDVLIVDVAGGFGQDLERFLEKFPDAPGRFILQDQPGVLERAVKHDRIEHMSYDYYTPQPVQGARTYFLHSILHGGGDERARTLLTILKAAMKKGYSKLLINENVLPATGCDPLASSLDLIMMGSQSALERNEAQWREVLESCGFRVIKIHTSVAVESIIEAELA